MAPRPRFESLDPAVKERLLGAAATEFAAHGFDGASYNRILAAAGISKGAAYYYFDDKLDLYVTVIRQALAVAMAAVGMPGPMPDAAAFWRELRGIYARTLQLRRAEPTLAALARGLAKTPERLLHEGPLGAELAGFDSWMATLLAHGQTIGAVRADLPAPLLAAITDAMGEAYDRWTMSHWDELVAAPDGIEGVVDRGMDLIRRLVEPAPVGRTP
jgi:AcrR family transcriptional regulator